MHANDNNLDFEKNGFQKQMGNCLSERFVSEEEHNRVRTLWISHNQHNYEHLLQLVNSLIKSDFDQKRVLNRLEIIQTLLQDEIAFCKRMEHKKP